MILIMENLITKIMSKWQENNWTTFLEIDHGSFRGAIVWFNAEMIVEKKVWGFSQAFIVI